MRRGHALLQARAASRRGVDCVAVLGGDGTLNEVATALAGTNARSPRCRAGRPTSSPGRSDSRNNPVDAARSTSRLVGRPGGIRSIGVGRLDDPRTGEHARTGRGAPQLRHAHRASAGTPHWSRTSSDTDGSSGTLGHGLFVWAGLRTQFGGLDRTRPHFSVRVRRRRGGRRRLLLDRAELRPLHVRGPETVHRQPGGDARPELRRADVCGRSTPGCCSGGRGPRCATART